MTEASLFENAHIVLRDSEFHGWVAMSGGRIVDMGEGRAPERGMDCRGDVLAPGFVELHTDHLESHLRPRPKVDWPTRMSIVAYDAQMVASGITTVFDSVRIGNDADYVAARNEAKDLVGEIAAAGREGVLRARHRTHLRCEICADDAVESAIDVMEAHHVDLISLMDHTPGARQFASIEAWKTYYGGKSGLPESQLQMLMDRKRELFEKNYTSHRAALVAMAHQNGVAIASHDDTNSEHVEESIADKVRLAEFPTSILAARLSHQAGISVLMGAPNVVRGGSHSGNVAAEALAREGLLDILSSDYVPASLLMGAFGLAHRINGYGLARAIRTISYNPARAAGIQDRGEIAIGQAADLVRISRHDHGPIIREVYRDGVRVF